MQDYLEVELIDFTKGEPSTRIPEYILNKLFELKNSNDYQQTYDFLTESQIQHELANINIQHSSKFTELVMLPTTKGCFISAKYCYINTKELSQVNFNTERYFMIDQIKLAKMIKKDPIKNAVKWGAWDTLPINSFYNPKENTKNRRKLNRNFNFILKSFVTWFKKGLLEELFQEKPDTLKNICELNTIKLKSGNITNLIELSRFTRNEDYNEIKNNIFKIYNNRKKAFTPQSLSNIDKILNTLCINKYIKTKDNNAKERGYQAEFRLVKYYAYKISSTFSKSEKKALYDNICETMYYLLVPPEFTRLPKTHESYFDWLKIIHVSETIGSIIGFDLFGVDDNRNIICIECKRKFTPKESKTITIDLSRNQFDTRSRISNLKKTNKIKPSWKLYIVFGEDSFALVNDKVHDATPFFNKKNIDTHPPKHGTKLSFDYYINDKNFLDIL